MKNYKIVFEGKIAEGHGMEDVKKNLAALYQVDVGEIQRLFTGRPIVLKENLDYQTAINDKETFEKTGAVCSIISGKTDAAPSAAPDGEAKRSTTGNKPGQPQSLLQPPPLRTNRRRYTIFHPLFMSFYSKGFYRDVAQNWKNYAFLYLLFLLALCSVVKTVKIHYDLADFITTHAPAFISQIPAVTFSNGKASTDQDKTYVIKDPKSGQDLIIVDTTGQVNSLNDTNAVMLLTETKLIVKKSDRETQVFALSDIEDFRLDQDVVYGWLGIVQKWLAVVFFPFLVLGSFLYRLVQVLIYGIIGMLFASILKTDIEFQSLISISIMAITPVVMIDVFMGPPGISAVLWKLVCFLIAMGYLFWGIKANSAPRDQSNIFLEQ
ncbi:MAG: DUF1189 family protein [Thermodesulfobacteriota bacterium]|nr:DUF1189 family protein [Thermodesulfobacteriota bacterium]